MTLGQRIISLREEKSISRKEFGDTLKISYAALSKYETNERFPDKELLVRIADFFDVSIDFLLGRTNIRKKDDIRIALNAISTDGLDEDDIEMIRSIIEKLKKKNNT